MSMTLEEAIAKYKESEKANKELAKKCMTALAKAENRYKAEECRQMIEWLRELQERRKQPEIIRCKDCENWDTTWQNDFAPNYHYCPLMDGTYSGDFYCAKAERRTDDKTNKGSSC